MLNKIKSICIVGGGTAGMIAALILKKRFGDNIKINIIKSEKIGIIGVGEGSTEHWKDFSDYVGISYKEIIKECDATCKSGIMFEGWSRKKFLRDISELTNSKFSQTFVGYLNVICSNNENKNLISNLHALKNKISSSALYFERLIMQCSQQTQLFLSLCFSATFCKYFFGVLVVNPITFFIGHFSYCIWHLIQ